MITLEEVQQKLNEIYPTKELLMFLTVAKMECINSVILEDLNAKIQILLENPKFHYLLQKFEPIQHGVCIGLDWAIYQLTLDHQIYLDNHNKLYLTISMDEQNKLFNDLDFETTKIYLQMAKMYRLMNIECEHFSKMKK